MIKETTQIIILALIIYFGLIILRQFTSFEIAVLGGIALIYAKIIHVHMEVEKNGKDR